MMNAKLIKSMTKVMEVLTVELSYNLIEFSTPTDNYYGYTLETCNFDITIEGTEPVVVRQIQGNPRKVIFEGTLSKALDFIRTSKTF